MNMPLKTVFIKKKKKAPVGRRQKKHHPYLFQWQQHELLRLGHLHKVLQDILVRRLEQVAAGVRVSESPDAQAVGGVQLAEEELTAGVPHPVELQQAGCWEQRLGSMQFKYTMSLLHQLAM